MLLFLEGILRGMVEHYFGALHHYTRRFTLVAKVKDLKMVIKRDYRLDAKLILFMLNQIIIKFILNHINKLKITGYSLTEDIIVPRFNFLNRGKSLANNLIKQTTMFKEDNSCIEIGKKELFTQ